MYKYRKSSFICVLSTHQLYNIPTYQWFHFLQLRNNSLKPVSRKFQKQAICVKLHGILSTKTQSHSVLLPLDQKITHVFGQCIYTVYLTCHYLYYQFHCWNYVGSVFKSPFYTQQHHQNTSQDTHFGCVEEKLGSASFK